MAAPTRSLLRPSPSSSSSSTLLRLTPHSQTRHASLLRRPHRPYTFTQLITLSDGSVVSHRTTSPVPIYRSAKDTRNHPLWNPSSDKLRNVEEDEAGRLKRFRRRFGRGWDGEVAAGEEEGEGGEEDGGLGDLISGFTSGAEEGDRRKREVVAEGEGEGEGRKSG